MIYPKLVPAWVCTTPIDIYIEGEGLSEEGEPTETKLLGLLCNWQDGGKVVYTQDEKIVEIRGRAYFDGDICPELSNITGGTATVHGETREILQGFKRRNPDGTVNHTEVQFK